MANKAVLVGINTYPGSPLAGCINDVMDTAEYLVKNHGFKEDEIRILTDSRATKVAIMERLAWLATAVPGDVVYFHYSGHGTQVASRNDNAEVDGLDEIICPFDFDWEPSHYITDNEMVDIFSKMPAGVVFNWCSDSCHSGTMTREVSSGPRSIVPPADIAWRIRTARTKAIQSKRGMIGGQLDVGFVSGCRADQTSADAVIGGRPCGAFTYYFLRALARMKDQPLGKVAEVTRNDLAKNGYSQSPQAEGARVNLPFLGGAPAGRGWVCS